MAPDSLDEKLDSAQFMELMPDGCFLSDASGHYIEVNAAGCQLLGGSRTNILGKTALDFTFPEDQEALRQRTAALQTQSSLLFEWRLRRLDGSSLDVEVHTRLLPSGGHQSIVRDISERKRRENELALEQATMARLHALRTLDLGGQADPALLEEILDAAIAAMEADCGDIQTLTPQGSALCVIAQRGLPADWHTFWSRVPAAHSVGGAALATKTRVIVVDDEKSELCAGTEVLAALRQAGVRTALSTPLISRSGELLGVLSTHCKTARRPSERALEMLDRLSRYAADILERRRLEWKLRRAEAVSVGALAISADAIISIDIESRIIEWNRGAELMFGYTQKEALAMSLAELLPAGKRAAHRDQVARFAAESGNGRHMDHSRAMGRRKSGAEFPIEATISHVEFDGSQIMTVAVRDVTEQRRRENLQGLLAELGGVLVSPDHDDAMQQIAKIAVARLADHAALFVVEGAENRLRRAAAATRDPALLWAVEQAMTLPNPLPNEHPIVQAVQAHRSVLYQIDPEQYKTAAQSPEHLRAIQEASPGSIIIAPLLIGKTCLGALGLSRRTEPFDAQDLSLAEEVARRCALYLENAHLHRAEQRATRARDEVLEIVAHDLRNPLNNINLQLQLLLRRRTDETGRWQEPAAQIRGSTARMNQLIQDLLDVTGLEAGALSMALTPLAPEQLLALAKETQQPFAAAAQIELRCEAAAGLPTVQADERRLLQVFQNLIGNALKFTPSGGLIVLGAERREHAVEFRVVDTGHGISDEHVAHLFDRFWRADRGDQRGVGLGLSIVKGIVQAHGGQVSVQSTPGCGTSFLFTIPTGSSPLG